MKHGGAAGRIRIPGWNPYLAAVTPARRGHRSLPRGGGWAEAVKCNLVNLNFPSIFYGGVQLRIITKTSSIACTGLHTYTFLIKVIFGDSLPFDGDTSVSGDASPWEHAPEGGAAQRIPRLCERQSRGKCMCFLHIIVAMGLRAGIGGSGEPWLPGGRGVRHR